MSQRGRRTFCWSPKSIGSRAWAHAGNGGEERPEAPSEERRQGEQERGAEWEMSPRQAPSEEWRRGEQERGVEWEMSPRQAPSEERRRGKQERWRWVARVKKKKRRWECGAMVRRGARHVAPVGIVMVWIVMVSPSETPRKGPEGARPKGDHLGS